MNKLEKLYDAVEIINEIIEEHNNPDQKFMNALKGIVCKYANIDFEYIKDLSKMTPEEFMEIAEEYQDAKKCCANCMYACKIQDMDDKIACHLVKREHGIKYGWQLCQWFKVK